MPARQETETGTNVIQFTSPWMHGAADIPGNMPETSLTDLGNAKRLVIGRRDDIRFCHTTRKRFIWVGTKWAKDDSGQIVRLAVILRVLECSGLCSIPTAPTNLSC
jgi:hypothetical protein